MASKHLPFQGSLDMEELEYSHKSFSGLIELAERLGAPEHELESYKEAKLSIEAQIQRLKAGKLPEE